MNYHVFMLAIVELAFSTCAVCAENGSGPIDYARSYAVHVWLHDPVVGDPSWDTFVHASNNPIHYGSPPFVWPVNGFLFEDPKSKFWYLYPGLYHEGYAISESYPSNDCIVYRSKDKGATWEYLGSIWQKEPFTFKGDTRFIMGSPDITVQYADGRYCLSYDWFTAKNWDEVNTGANGADSGIAYAWSDKPEGPYTRYEQPATRVSKQPVLRGKYKRTYAQSLFKRKHDWIMVAMMDGGPFFSWAYVAVTAPTPEGPFSAPTFIRCVDEDYYHPPLLEFFPAFIYGEYLYAPATSVALNRNYQTLFRAKLERAHDPAAWEIVQEGSVWHSEDLPNEYYGIWGQTFSGFVDADRMFHVMFPSRDKKNWGTINIASRPWDKPFRDSGFVLTGHAGRSFTCIKRSYKQFELQTEFKLRGTMRICWGFQAPIGPNTPAADATQHELMRTRQTSLEIGDTKWRLLQADKEERVVAEGSLNHADSHALTVRCDGKGTTSCKLDGKTLWTGTLVSPAGPLGLWVDANTHLEVETFNIAGAASTAKLNYLYTDGLLGTGVNMADWDIVKSDEFRYGTGAVRKTEGGRVKWNIRGQKITVWSPTGPDYGTVEVVIDGKKAGEINLHSTTEQPSAPRFAQGKLGKGGHAVILRSLNGRLAADSLEVE